VGTVAALGVAFGALGTALAYALGFLHDLPFWQLCLAFVLLLLLVSGPSMLIAWLKLRQRNLAPILDANGWAVNGRVKMSVRFGASLTSVAQVPPGASYASSDPFADPPRLWPKLLVGLLALCFLWSFLDSQGLVYRITKATLGPADAFGTTPEELRLAEEMRERAREKR
jgi:hypothetical protein